MPESWPSGPIKLLVMQATPFCNIDCKYCYLPNRNSKGTMYSRVVEKTIQRLTEANLIEDKLRILWHAGEPLVAGIQFYRNAISQVQANLPSNVSLTNSLQTNALLLNNDWCKFFIEAGIEVGVSIDGPAHLHDAQRVDRRGQSTHRHVEAGIMLMKENNVPIRTITVLTDTNVDHPVEVFEYLMGIGADSCCFNVDEIQGVRTQTSLTSEDAYTKVKTFFSVFYDRWMANDRPFSVREFTSAMSAIKDFDPNARSIRRKSQQTTPFQVLTVGIDGSFSTFSPELLNAEIERYGSFNFGNLLESPLKTAFESASFIDAYRDMRLGINLCRETCDYFGICGGGIPANKALEHGTLNSAETIHCRLHIQAPFDVIAEEVGKQIGN